MTPQELDARLEAATPIVRAAGALALDYFRNRGALAIEHKGQQDLVSIADRDVEDLMRERWPQPSRAMRCWARRAGAATPPADLGARPDRRHLQLPQGHPVLGRGRRLRRRRADRDRPHLRPGPRRAVRRPARRRRVPQRRARSGSRAMQASTPRAWPWPTASASRRRHYVAMVEAALSQGFEHRRCGSTAIQLCWVADGRCDAFVTRSARPGTASPA